MPLTTIYGDGTRVVGDGNSFPQTLHPNVANYLALVISEGYTPPVERVEALNDLTWNLVGSGIWDKCKAIYPFIGGTTGNQHRHNLKDPRATTAAFMITWSGGVTFSDNGNQGNNTSGLGNTNLIPSTHLAAATSIHISAYVNVAQTSPGALGRLVLGAGNVGVSDLGTSPASSNNYYTQINNSGLINSGVNTAAFYCANRTSNTVSRLFRNGIQVGSTSATAAVASTSAIGIHARTTSAGGAGAPYYSNSRVAFVSIGDGISLYEQRILYSMVQRYQIALGRQV